MPWNDNATPGGKPGPKRPNPWGDRPSGGGDDEPPRGEGPRPTGGPGRKRPSGGPIPPDFNDLVRKFTRQVEGLFGGGDGGGGIKPGAFAVVGGAILLLWALSGIYAVSPNQQAVIRTFGAYTGWNGPGLNYHLPWPVQSVTKVNVTDLNQIAIGADKAERLMLTGDENIVDIQFTVLWKVNDAADFTFSLREPADAIKAVAESAMREVVGRNALTPIMTTARGDVQAQVADLMQRVLDSYKAGVSIQEVQITGAGPPQDVPDVVEAFRDVQSAQQDREALVNAARGAAAQRVQQALGYKAQAVQEAEGEAAAFNQVYVQYKAAPAVTRQRLYIETMQKVLAGSNKIIVDSKGASAPIILPPDAFRPRQPSSGSGQAGAGGGR